MSSRVQVETPSTVPVGETAKVQVRDLNFYYGQAQALRGVSFNLFAVG